MNHNSYLYRDPQSDAIQNLIFQIANKQNKNGALDFLYSKQGPIREPIQEPTLDPQTKYLSSDSKIAGPEMDNMIRRSAENEVLGATNYPTPDNKPIYNSRPEIGDVLSSFSKGIMPGIQKTIDFAQTPDGLAIISLLAGDKGTKRKFAGKSYSKQKEYDVEDAANSAIKENRLKEQFSLLKDYHGKDIASNDKAAAREDMLARFREGLMAKSEEAEKQRQFNAEQNRQKAQDKKDLSSLISSLRPQRESKKISQSQVANMSGAKTAINELDNAKKRLGTDTIKTGPIEGILSKNPYSNTGKRFQTYKGEVRQIIGKYLEGGVLRKEDEVKYEKILPTEFDTPQQINDKANMLRDLMVDKHNQQLQDLSDAGYDPGNLKTIDHKQIEIIPTNKKNYLYLPSGNKVRMFGGPH